MRLLIAQLALLLALGPIAALRSEEPAADKTPVVAANSPESVFAAYHAAAEKHDYGLLFDLSSPRSQVGYVFELIFTEEFVRDAAFTKLKEKYYDERKSEAEALRIMKALGTQQLPEEEVPKLIDRHVQHKRQYFIEGMTRLGQIQPPGKHRVGALRELASEPTRAKGVAAHTSEVRGTSFEKPGKPIDSVEQVTLDQPQYFVLFNGQWKVATVMEWEAVKK